MWLQILTCILLLAIVVFLTSIAISSAVCKRSFTATLVAFYLRIVNPRISDKKVIKGLRLLPKKNDVRYVMPKRITKKYQVKEQYICGVQTFIFNEQQSKQTAVIYLHGGGYVRQPRYHHVKFLARLSVRASVTVIAPIYPKAPKHSAEQVYPLLTELYKTYRKKYKRIVLMGDSSGGGLALGLAQDFLINNTPQPDKLILLSPWLDISLSHKDLPIYEKKDPLVWASAERIWGKEWAKNLPITDYKVSPIFGEVKGLKDVTLIFGDREMLYPENMQLYNKLIDNQIKTRLIVGRAMNHVYPIYPIKEAKTAFVQIIDIIKS